MHSLHLKTSAVQEALTHANHVMSPLRELKNYASDVNTREIQLINWAEVKLMQVVKALSSYQRYLIAKEQVEATKEGWTELWASIPQPTEPSGRQNEPS